MSPPIDIDIAPSQKTMQFLKTRNNISRRMLDRQLNMFEREKTFNLTTITQESLDLKEILRQIKRCSSDDLPEAKHWLGRRHATTARPQTDENGIPRDIATAPAWTTQGADTAPEAQPDPDLAIMKLADEEPDRTEIRTKIQRGAPPTALQMSYMRLFGKRNAYADVKADAGDTFSDLFSKTPSQAGRTPSGRRTGFSDYSDTVDTVATENRRTPGSMLSSAASGRRVNILTMGGDKTRGRRGRGDRRRADGDDDDDEEEGDWMKTLLTDKSRKRQRQRRRRHTPLPDRINDFYKKLDKLKEDEKAPPTKEFQRRWIVLTRGVKAALAESSDEEEQVLHTI